MTIGPLRQMNLKAFAFRTINRHHHYRSCLIMKVVNMIQKNMSNLTLCGLENSSSCTFANSEHLHEGSLTNQKEKHRPNDNRGYLLSGSILNHLMHSKPFNAFKRRGMYPNVSKCNAKRCVCCTHLWSGFTCLISLARVFSFIYCWVLIFAISPFLYLDLNVL